MGKIKTSYREFGVWFIGKCIKFFCPENDRALYVEYIKMKLKIITEEEFSFWQENRMIKELPENPKAFIENLI